MLQWCHRVVRMNVSVLMSPCQTAGRMIYCYLSRFATGLLMQEDGSCPRSSGGRAMTLRGSQSAGEAQRPGWWLVVRARPGLAAPVTTSTWSASPCTGRRTRPVTTPTRTWTTRTLWWSVIGSRGTTVGRVECSATFLSATAAVARRGPRTSRPPRPATRSPSTFPPPTSPTSSPRSCPRPGRRSHWTCPRPVRYSRAAVRRARVRLSPTEPCSPGSISWWRRPSPASRALSWPESAVSSPLYKWYLTFYYSETITLPDIRN